MAGVYLQFDRQFKEHPVAIILATTSVLGLGWVLHDYREWKALGTGGTPPSPRGYLGMTFLRLKFFFNDVHDFTTVPTDGPSYIKAPLPQRTGPAPKLMPRILPQRQQPEHIPADVRDRLQNLMQSLATEHPDLLIVKPSETEGRSTDGLYPKEGIATLNPAANHPRLHKEIAHAHPLDNSLHVWVTLADVRKVMEAGWGIKFCLPPIPGGWIMVYAPRNDEELKVIETIVKAAVRHITGVEI